ncbi:MAG: thioredoxin family protein [Gammaproteobacteria bacterium]|nr:thioredoxin family protein [Gammaproteobacteria bacterium]
MNTPKLVSQIEWLDARKKLLVREKELTRLRDQIAVERRELPWVKVDREYIFHDANGQKTLSDLFGDKSQLMIYHFMLGPDWEEGCTSCSFWADNFNGIDIHLAHRDISFLAVSRAEYDKLAAYKKRMGWTFNWVSSFGSDFNYDYQVSFTPEQKEKNATEYNYRGTEFFSDELVGVSVFAKDEQGEVFHTYSTYSRGVDMLNGAYNYIDLSPKGRDEENGMSWLRRHDEYD